MANNGIFIVFDGVDGAGKTTQVNLLAEKLSSIGREVVISKEPTAGRWGQKLRESAFTGRLPFDVELEYFIKDRDEHIQQLINPALKAGKIVILDRYMYSTIAYQGILTDDLVKLETAVRENALNPDITFIMDIPASLAAYRIKERDGKPNEFERLEDLSKVGEVFRSITANDSTCQIIDGALPIDHIHNQIIKYLVNGPFLKKMCLEPHSNDDPLYCVLRYANACEWWNIKDKLKSPNCNF